MTIVKWTPFMELDSMERSMRRWFEGFSFAPAIAPATDIYETDDEYVVEVEVPGFEEKELAVEVFDHTPELGCGITLETWYGHLVAEIVYEGPFGEAQVEEVKRLHRFISDCGYEIAGDAEEEYLTRPGEEPQRTIVRYEICQAHHH